MGGALFRLERKGHLRGVFLFSIALVLLVQIGFLALGEAPSVLAVATLLCLFFTGFNALEASQPSLVSRLAAPAHRGTALGVYNTLQSLGFFAGGAVGGWLSKTQGASAIFMSCAALALLWLLLAWPMEAPAVAGRCGTEVAVPTGPGMSGTVGSGQLFQRQGQYRQAGEDQRQRRQGGAVETESVRQRAGWRAAPCRSHPRRRQRRRAWRCRGRCGPVGCGIQSDKR